jgi:hypothetical protein
MADTFSELIILTSSFLLPRQTHKASQSPFTLR